MTRPSRYYMGNFQGTTPKLPLCGLQVGDGGNSPVVILDLPKCFTSKKLNCFYIKALFHSLSVFLGPEWKECNIVRFELCNLSPSAVYSFPNPL
jgi:hypothetical protein